MKSVLINFPILAFIFCSNKNNKFFLKYHIPDKHTYESNRLAIAQTWKQHCCDQHNWRSILYFPQSSYNY